MISLPPLHTLARILLVLPVMLMPACGSDDNSEPPAELTEITPRADIEYHWSVSPNDGIGRYFVYMEPLLTGDHIVTAGREGLITAIQLDTGDVAGEIDLDMPLGAGIGGDATTWLVTDGNGEVLAVDAATGEIRWRRKVSSEVLAAPVSVGNRVYVRSVDGQVFNLDAETGEANWSYSKVLPSLTLRGSARPVYTRDWVMISGEDGHLVALDHDSGKVVWDVELSAAGGRSEIERLVDIDGVSAFYGQVLYAVGYQGRMAAIDVGRGQVLWARPFSSHTGVSVDDKAVYVTDDRSHIWAVDRFNGATLWKQDRLTAREVTRPVIAGDYLVVGDYAGVLHVLSRFDGSIVAREFTGDSDDDEDEGIFLPPVVENGRVIVTLRDGSMSSYSINPRPAP